MVGGYPCCCDDEGGGPCESTTVACGQQSVGGTGPTKLTIVLALSGTWWTLINRAPAACGTCGPFNALQLPASLLNGTYVLDPAGACVTISHNFTIPHTPPCSVTLCGIDHGISIVGGTNDKTVNCHGELLGQRVGFSLTGLVSSRYALGGPCGGLAESSHYPTLRWQMSVNCVNETPAPLCTGITYDQMFSGSFVDLTPLATASTISVNCLGTGDVPITVNQLLVKWT